MNFLLTDWDFEHYCDYILTSQCISKNCFHFYVICHHIILILFYLKKFNTLIKKYYITLVLLCPQKIILIKYIMIIRILLK